MANKWIMLRSEKGDWICRVDYIAYWGTVIVGGVKRWAAYASDRREIGWSEDDITRDSLEIADVIPNTTGMVQVNFWLAQDGTVRYEYLSIIGWVGPELVPFTMDGISTAPYWGVYDPVANEFGGAPYKIPGVGDCATLEEAVEAVKAVIE